MANDGWPPSDDGGVLLADLAAAKVEALRLLGAVLFDEPEAMGQLPMWTVSILEAGEVVLRLDVVPTAACPAKAKVGA